MNPRLSRSDALRILGLGPSADISAVKRAYRRLAREVHPDVGGDPDRFLELQHAYQRLLATRRRSDRAVARGSRPQSADWAEPPTRRFSDDLVDTTRIDWGTPIPDRAVLRADAEYLSVLLAAPGPGPVHPVTARSRGPRSPMNRLIRFLDPDLTATWRIGSARERGLTGHDVELRLRVWSRSARRRVDRQGVPTGWTIQRGSSSATLARTLHPSRERRATAVRSVASLCALLEAIDWPLDSWFLVLDP